VTNISYNCIYPLDTKKNYLRKDCLIGIFLQISRVWFASKSCAEETTQVSVCLKLPELKRAEALRAVVSVLHPNPSCRSAVPPLGQQVWGITKATMGFHSSLA